MNMRGGQSARPAQFELMISFMERHGDIQSKLCGLNTQARLENLQKWIELTDLLNDKALGDPKPIDKWRKCWSDFKNNTKKKARKLKSKEVRANLTDLERRLLILMEDNKSDKRKASVSDYDDEDAANILKFQEEIEPDQCERTSSPLPHFFQDADREAKDQRKSSSSSASTSSNSEPTCVKRQKRFKSSMENHLADKFLEFEREKEKMAHEREMARINQNDKFVSIFGRIVTVIETLAPSIQRFLDRDTNDDR